MHFLGGGDRFGMAAMAGAGLPGAARRGRCRWRQRVQVTMAEVAAADVAMVEVVPAAGVPVSVGGGGVLVGP